MGKAVQGRMLGAALVLLGIAVRLRNAWRYPPDWGFDAAANWRYIYRLSQDGSLPPPEAGWSTIDPPLYFALGAALWHLCEGLGARDLIVRMLPLLNALLGLATAALAALAARALAPQRERRVWLAGLLVLFLPAHIHVSAMVNEEVLLAFWAALFCWLLLRRQLRSDGSPRTEVQSECALGLASGLALLTKLSGAVLVAAAALVHLGEGWRTRNMRRAGRALALLLLATSLSGGAFLARNALRFASLQPVGLPAHQRMLEMPPGERGLLDYLYIPVATWTDPQLLNPDLLHSVWGSTYASAWFDAHRYFLPRDGVGVNRLGTLTLLLALLPTAAGLVGVARGLRRIRRGDGATDGALLAIALPGLVAYAWYVGRNPWFAVLKASSLSPLLLPFALYASDVLEDWMGRHPVAGVLVGAALIALAGCVAAGTAFDFCFARPAISGLAW